MTWCKKNFEKKKTLSYIKGGRTRIDTSKVREQGEVEEFASALKESFPGPPDTNACNRREHLKNAALPCSFSARKTNKTADWFESHPKEMTPVTAEKRGACCGILLTPLRWLKQIKRTVSFDVTTRFNAIQQSTAMYNSHTFNVRKTTINESINSTINYQLKHSKYTVVFLLSLRKAVFLH